MECKICKRNATTCRVILGNIVVAQSEFCSSECLKSGIELLVERIRKGVACIQSDIDRHITAECDCIPQYVPDEESAVQEHNCPKCDVVSKRVYWGATKRGIEFVGWASCLKASD
jgi:hypothetical protein